MKSCSYGFRPCTRCHSGKTNHHALDRSRSKEFRPEGSGKTRRAAILKRSQNIELDELVQWYSRELPGQPCNCDLNRGGCECPGSAVWRMMLDNEPRRLATLRELDRLARIQRP